jgi:hypothetical protein
LKRLRHGMREDCRVALKERVYRSRKRVRIRSRTCRLGSPPRQLQDRMRVRLPSERSGHGDAPVRRGQQESEPRITRKEIAMAAFKEIARNAGVDSLAGKTAHIVVPKNGVNFVKLANGAGYRVAATKATADMIEISMVERAKYHSVLGGVRSASILETDVVYAIKGLRGGLGEIYAESARDKVKLNFSVHPKSTLVLSFFFIADEISPTEFSKRSRFGIGDADRWIEFASTVFGPQANMWCEKGYSKILKVKDLGPAVSPSNEEKFINLKDAQLPGSSQPPSVGKEARWQIPVFLAGEHVKSSDKSDPLGYHNDDSKVIVLKDQATPTADSKIKSSLPKTLCHEIAHFLNKSRKAGGGHGAHSADWKMSDILDTMDEGDIKIPSQRAMDWNPWYDKPKR